LVNTKTNDFINREKKMLFYDIVFIADKKEMYVYINIKEGRNETERQRNSYYFTLFNKREG
jgi:hypothetical protein